MNIESHDKTSINQLLVRDAVRQKQGLVQKFVDDYNEQKTQNNNELHMKLSSIVHAIESVSNALQATIPTACMGYAQGNISAAESMSRNTIITTGEVILKGQCPVGLAFLRQASFIGNFTSDADNFAMEVYHYFFNYTRSELMTDEVIDMVLLAKKIQRVVQNLIVCGETRNTTKYLFRDMEINKVAGYHSAAKPDLKLSTGGLLFKTPIGLYGVLDIDKIYMFPEIMSEVVKGVCDELEKVNITKESLVAGYNQLLTELENIALLYKEYPNSLYNQEENMYYTNMPELGCENSVYISTSFSVKLKPCQDKIDIIIYNNGTTVRLRYKSYKNDSGDLYLVKTINTDTVSAEHEVLFNTNDTVLFGHDPQLFECLDFELNFIPRISDMIDKLVMWKTDRQSLLQNELQAQEERQLQEEARSKPIPPELNI